MTGEIEMHRPALASLRLMVRAPLVMLAAIAWLASPAAHAQISLRDPALVKEALATLNGAVATTGQLIAAHEFDRLPHASQELERALDDLEEGLGRQPSPARPRLEQLVGRARVAASAMREAVGSHQDSMIPLTEAQLTKAVTEIIALFPASLRPSPGGRRGRSAVLRD